MSSFSARASWFNIGRRGTPKRSCSMSVIRCCETVSPLRPLIRAASSICVRPSSSRRRAMSSPKDFTLLSPHVLSLNRQTSHGSFFLHRALLHVHESAFLPLNQTHCGAHFAPCREKTSRPVTKSDAVVFAQAPRRPQGAGKSAGRSPHSGADGRRKPDDRPWRCAKNS